MNAPRLKCPTCRSRTRLRRFVCLCLAWFVPQLGTAGVTLSYLPPPDGAWQTEDAAGSGWNVSALGDLARFARARHSTGLLIVHDGKIVAEHYWPVTRRDALIRPRFYFFLSRGATKEGWPIEDVASVQKSLVSILAGRAAAMGLIDIDAPVSRYLGPAWSKAGDAEGRILVRHLLSMNSGLDTQLGYAQPAGAHWRYNTPAYSRLIPLLEAATRQPIEQLSKAWVFDPIGMRDSGWASRSRFWMGADGAFNTVGFVTTPRDLARLGLLVLMDGKWGGKDVIGNREWFRQSLSPSQDLNPAYGFLWWLNGSAKHVLSLRSSAPSREGPLVPEAPPDLVVAMGHEKRRLYILPSRKLVIVRFGSDPGGAFDRKFWAHAAVALPPMPNAGGRHEGS